MLPPHDLYSYRIVPAWMGTFPPLHPSLQWHRPRTATYNFFARLDGLLGPATYLLINRAGTGISIAPPDNALDVTAPTMNDDYGILLGRGTTPFHVDAHDLDDPIPNGSSPGQLDYEVTTVERAILTSAYTMLVSRKITNFTNADIQVTEMGLFGQHSPNQFLHLYDTFVSPVTFSPSVPLLAQYAFTTTDPAP